MRPGGAPWTILRMSVQWTDPSWRSEAEEWIRAEISDLGCALTDPIEHSHVRPWGTVARVSTDNGLLWFKANIAPLTFELRLIELLAAHAVPHLVAREPSRGWMLMEDAGPLVSELYGEEPPLVVWREFLCEYARLQVAAAPAAEKLIAAGVPDRRLPSLLEPFERVLDDDRLVRPPKPDALTPDELDRLHALMPKLQESVAALAVLGLPDSVQHDDLHPWNVCVEAGEYRFIDWGDACVSQPMLTLEIPLQWVGRDGSAVAKEAYLEPWTALRPQEDLLAATEAAALLAQVTGVLKWDLINSALNDEERVGYEHGIPRRLRHLLELAGA
jgi:Phosphotransferase enzyme family